MESAEELQADVVGVELFGELGQGQAMAEPLVPVHDQGDRDAGGAHLAGESDGPLEFGPVGDAGGDLLGEDPAHPGRRAGVENSG